MIGAVLCHDDAAFMRPSRVFRSDNGSRRPLKKEGVDKTPTLRYLRPRRGLLNSRSLVEVG